MTPQETIFAVSFFRGYMSSSSETENFFVTLQAF